MVSCAPRSFCEADYIVLATKVQEPLYRIQLLDKLVDICCQVQIYGGHRGTIALSKDPVNRQGRSINIRYHFIPSTIHASKIVVYYCPTTDMI